MVPGSNPSGGSLPDYRQDQGHHGKFFLFFLFIWCFDFVPFAWDPRKSKLDVAFPPSCGPPRRQGLRSQFRFCPHLFGDPRECRGDEAFPPSFGATLTLSALLGTAENAGLM